MKTKTIDTLTITAVVAALGLVMLRNGETPKVEPTPESETAEIQLLPTPEPLAIDIYAASLATARADSKPLLLAISAIGLSPSPDAQATDAALRLDLSLDQPWDETQTVGEAWGVSEPAFLIIDPATEKYAILPMEGSK